MFCLSLKQNLLYAHTETTLNGEISTESVYISVNNNTNLNIIKILSNYIIWNRLSQKTISRYCPFNVLDLSLHWLDIVDDAKRGMYLKPHSRLDER